MNVIGWMIRVLARSLAVLGRTFVRAANLLWGLLPVLLAPNQLREQVQSRYATMYTPKLKPTKEEMAENMLDSWEKDVLDRYRINAGRMLVMGSGWGREAHAIARRGVTVVGLDTNLTAVREAQRFAAESRLPASFHQADFTELPYAEAEFDFAMLAGTMYSAIPTSAGRRAWLNDIARILKPEGLALLSFDRELSSPSRVRTICANLNRYLCRLPGANHAYQPGDSYSAEHFMHIFQHEEDLRAELTAGGARIREFNWVQGYAVLAFAP